MISFDEAFELVGQHVKLTESETVPIGRVLGRFVAEDIRAIADVPGFDNSAVDGYAVCDLAGGSLRQAMEVRAGKPAFETLQPGLCARIFTGAPIPPGTAGIAMQEDVKVRGDHVEIPSVTAGAHIRRQGEDVRRGDLLLSVGNQMKPATIGALAAAGVSEGKVFKLPRVSILVTGDELVAPGQPLAPGQIYESNSLALASALQALGIAAVRVERVADDREALTLTIKDLLANSDILLTSGGVSVGDYDLVRPILSELEVEEIFWRVAMKPAKPTYFGIHGSGAVFGLPGNPVSALVAFYLFVRPFIIAGQGGVFGLPETHELATEEITKQADREEFVPGRITPDGIEPILARASHKPNILALADGLIRLSRETTKVEKGAKVNVIPLHWSAVL